MRRIRDQLVTFAVRHSRLAKHHLDFDIAVQLGGRVVKIPIVGGVGLSNTTPTEPGIGKVIGAILRHRAGAFIDVGANIGQTLLKVLSHDWCRDYVGFDVQPFCRRAASLRHVARCKCNGSRILPDRPVLHQAEISLGGARRRCNAGLRSELD